jgi:hypothetical protein
MIISIRQKGKHKLSIWLPSSPLIINTFLKFVKFEDKKIPRASRLKIVKAIKKLKRIHKPLILVEIQSKDGDQVYLKF